MGNGISMSSGADPLDAWRGRINNFGSVALSAALRTLLSGNELACADGVIEVSAIQAGLPNRHRLTVRIPQAPYVADLVLSAVPAVECANPDDRDSSPSPDRWIRPVAGNAMVWELFNCRLHTLTSRPN